MTPPADDPKKQALASALNALRAAAAAKPAAETDSVASALASLRSKAAEPSAAPDDSRAGTGNAAPGGTPSDRDAGLAALRASVTRTPASPHADVAASLRDMLAPARKDDAAPAQSGASDGPAKDDPLDVASAPGPAEDDPLAALLDLPADPGAGAPALPVDDPLADLLAMPSPEPDPVPEDDPIAALFAEPSADPLAGLDDFLGTPDTAEPDPLAGLDDLLAAPAPSPDPLAGLDDLLAPPPAEPDPLAGLDDLLAAPAPSPDPLAGLDDILAPPPAEPDPLAGLDDLLAAPAPSPDPLAGLDDLLAEPAAAPDPLAGLDDLLAAPPPKPAAPLSAFGRLTATAPTAQALERGKFRIAVLGDFSGRASRGLLETGDALARRRAIRLDPDTAEGVIDGFATKLVLPVGQDGAGIAVPLKGIDSLHPDALVENVALFAELKGLRQRLSTPSTAAKAVAEMQAWAGAFTAPVQPAQARSGAQSVPADRRLSDFQALIGDRAGMLSKPSPVADLIGRIVGPHVVPGPSPEAKALRGAVDAAMTAAMRLVLHHPDFQAIEAAWRTVDLLARRIETDAKLEVVLYDVSAEEVAADLGVEDIGTTGLFKLLARPLMEEGQTGFSAVCGLYTFEETPPHAALLGRLGQIGAFIGAPILTALSPSFLDTPAKNRHPLVAQAWDGLRRDPVAHWLGLASPRVLLRRPYGAFSEPIDAFDFEEFSLAEGLSGMLWGNPASLATVLLAQAWTKGGNAMVLGQQMTLGDMPYHVVTDPNGDQVQLPCTERNMNTDKVEATVARGLMPVIGIKGRDVVRLGSFQSLAGQEIAGRWSGTPPPTRGAGDMPTLTATIPAGASVEAELDALLAGFGAPPSSVDPAAIDADLAALLEGL